MRPQPGTYCQGQKNAFQTKRILRRPSGLRRIGILNHVLAPGWRNRLLNLISAKTTVLLRKTAVFESLITTKNTKPSLKATALCFWGEIWDSELMRAPKYAITVPSPGARVTDSRSRESAGFEALALAQKKQVPAVNDGLLLFWGEIWDSNPRPSGPQPDALTNCANPTRWKMACLGGFEPSTYCLEGSCSIQLS